ncbi:unnamed protein product [Leptosia nina]|uniref:Uncharacterized protein n=1 Tax=Leptosia nina TaxID=320188 RepID=A0AAV1JXI2_9NEOP
MFAKISHCVVLCYLVANVHSLPLHEVERPSFWSLSPRIASAGHMSRHEALESRQMDSRLPLPLPQELEAIKKVAQVLVMLGEQVIPDIISQVPTAPAYTISSPSPAEVPNDPVYLN